jgi:hypothetical protein
MRIGARKITSRDRGDLRVLCCSRVWLISAAEAGIHRDTREWLQRIAKVRKERSAALPQGRELRRSWGVLAGGLGGTLRYC